jgi:hypothetical protein
MINISEYYKMVEDAINVLGVDPETCKDENEQGAWALMRGDQEVWMDCWYVEEEEIVYFQVLAPIFEIPEDMPAEFYRELLEVNYTLIGASFGVFKSMLALKLIREVNNFSKEDALLMISRVGGYAEQYGPVFSEKYLGIDPGQISEN